MQRYLDEYAKGQPHAAFGSYLAGFTLERMGEYTGAMRYYDEALAVNDFKSLREPVRRLGSHPLSGQGNRSLPGRVETRPHAPVREKPERHG
jgi:hypothetical protein